MFYFYVVPGVYTASIARKAGEGTVTVIFSYSDNDEIQEVLL